MLKNKKMEKKNKKAISRYIGQALSRVGYNVYFDGDTEEKPGFLLFSRNEKDVWIPIHEAYEKIREFVKFCFFERLVIPKKIPGTKTKPRKKLKIAYFGVLSFLFNLIVT